MPERDGLGGLHFSPGRPSGARPAAVEAARRRRRRLWIPGLVALCALLVIGVVVGVSAAGVNRLAGLFGSADYGGNGTGSVVVQVASGDSATAIGRTLYHDGVVASVSAFTSAADANSASGSIGPGYYRLHHHMKASLALALLLNPASRVASRVAVPEGFTVRQILARIAADTSIPLATLQQAAADPKALGAPGYAGSHLEGFCFPATYDIPPHTGATDVLRQMVAEFNAQAGTLGLAAGAARLGYAPYQVLTIASIVQAEGKRSADFPKIARVFYNRLAAHMPLGSDVTLYYVLGPGHGPLTATDLASTSPYNTRIHAGLPPTPIGNPGAAALSAALAPASGSWLYFTTIDKSGTTLFETTYAQHQADAAIAHRNGLS